MPRVLHLDRNGAAVPGDRPVHLADRGRRDRLGIPALEQPLRRLAELLLDHPGRQFRAHRRHAVLQPAERPADRRSQPVVHVAGHLAELDHDALHRAERGSHVVGGLHGQVVAQPLPVLAGRHEQPRRAGRVPQAAAHGELGGRQPAVESQPPHPAPHQATPAALTATPAARATECPLAVAHARAAARIRRVMRCLASSTPGSPRKTASSTPRACRISSRRAGVSSGAV